MKIIGIDLDGVLADFNTAYRRVLGETSGRWLIPEGEEPPCWAYATEYGYTKDEDRAAWAAIKANDEFWATLRPYVWTPDFLARLNDDSDLDDEWYFITTRVGKIVKIQSEGWLLQQGEDNPTVLIARGDKGAIAAGLQCTHFLDDRPENCLSVKAARPACEVYLLSWRYNEAQQEGCRAAGVHILTDPLQFLDALGLPGETERQAA